MFISKFTFVLLFYFYFIVAALKRGERQTKRSTSELVEREKDVQPKMLDHKTTKMIKIEENKNKSNLQEYLDKNYVRINF